MERPLVAPMATLWGSFCNVATLSVIETIWTKFGQNPGFSQRKSVSLSPGLTVKQLFHVIAWLPSLHKGIRNYSAFKWTTMIPNIWIKRFIEIKNKF